jgi:phage terminase large subunit
VTLHHTACSAFERPGNYAHMLPEYSQARKAIWNATNPHTGKKRIDEAFPMEIRSYTREQEMIIGFPNNSTWQVVGSDNYDSLMGTSFAGLVMSEFALGNPSAWGYFSPILMENNGWAIFISTPRGKNHFYNMMNTAKKHKDWFAETSTASDTGVFTKEQLEDELQRLIDTHGTDYGRALWMQEYFCSFDAAIPGSIWGDAIARCEREGRICEYDVDPNLPVYTAWDLGRTDDTSIWFYQFNGKYIDVFDCFSKPFMDINNPDEPEKGLVQVLLEKAKKFNIKYAVNNLPHDARPRTLAAGGKSILQQLNDCRDKNPVLGKFTIIPRLDKQEGIQAARKTFPYVRFHKRCEEGIEALKYYHREWDEETRTFSDSAAHDWSSHACFVGETEVLTRNGMCRIMNLPEDGEVMTLCGWSRYAGPFLTKKNARLVEVEFSDGNTVKCTPEHLFLTDKGWKSARSLTKGSVIQSTLTQSHSISTAVCTVYGMARNTFQKAVAGFIGTFGNWHLARFLKNVTYITKIQIQPTIEFQTLSACHPANILENLSCMQNQLVKKQGMLRQNGIGRKKEDCGIADTLSDRKDGRSGSVLKKSAYFAQKLISGLIEKAVTLKSSVTPTAKPLTIVTVKDLKESADVWDITVPNIGHFSLSNGAIVHNSDAFRYLSLSWKIPKQKSSEIITDLTQHTLSNMSFGNMKKQHMQRMRQSRQ